MRTVLNYEQAIKGNLFLAVEMSLEEGNYYKVTCLIGHKSSTKWGVCAKPRLVTFPVGNFKAAHRAYTYRIKKLKNNTLL